MIVWRQFTCPGLKKDAKETLRPLIAHNFCFHEPTSHSHH
jgi:hypothetical protein